MGFGGDVINESLKEHVNECALVRDVPSPELLLLLLSCTSTHNIS